MNEKELRSLLAKSKVEHETEKIEFKTKGAFSNSNKISRQLVAFANRNGGYILFGVKDDGSIEGVKLKPQGHKQQVSLLAQSCSPPIRISSYFFNLSEGDILVIQVHSESDIPHAIVKRDSSNRIKERTYYLRTIAGTTLVTDTQLKRLFSAKKEPNIIKKFPINIFFDEEPYDSLMPYSHEIRNYYNFQIDDLPVTKHQHLFSSLLNDIKPESLDSLWENIGQKFKEVLIEIIPFVILKSLALYFSESWDIEIIQKKNQIKTQIKNKGLPLTAISFADIEISEELIILKHLSVEMNGYLGYEPIKIVLPNDTKITLTYKKDKDELLSKIDITNDNSFSIEIVFKLNLNHVSSIYAVHPYATAYDEFGPPYDYYENRMLFTFDVEIKSNLFFIEDDDLFDAHEKFLENFNNLVKYLWDWNYFIDNLPSKDSFLNREINSKIDFLVREVGELKKISKEEK